MNIRLYSLGNEFLQCLVTLHTTPERHNPGNYAMNSGGLNEQLPASHKMPLPGVKTSHTYSSFTHGLLTLSSLQQK